MASKFKDAQNRFLTSSLFYETKYDTTFAIYSNSEEDKEVNGVVYPSLRKLYMEMADPTEYSFAIKYFYSWSHWLAIVNGSKPLQAMVQEWRDELEVKLRSQGVLNMIETSTSGAKEAVAASKWLSDRGWDKRKAGAPSKTERIRQTKIAEAITSEVAEDAARLGLSSTTIN